MGWVVIVRQAAVSMLISTTDTDLVESLRSIWPGVMRVRSQAGFGAFSAWQCLSFVAVRRRWNGRSPKTMTPSSPNAWHEYDEIYEVTQF